jgi:aromatic-L-amino-acid decarboxylase
VCEAERLWLHIDSAYAGVAAMLPEHAHILAGADRADSLVVNPHKWLFTPFDLSAFFCRRMDVVRQAFSLVPDYLKPRRGCTSWTRASARPAVPFAEAVDDPALLRREGVLAKAALPIDLARQFAGWAGP